MPLSERDRMILRFEGEWPGHAARKEEAIRSELELSPPRYYQLLGRLIDSADAQKHDPMLIGRLRRMRDERLSSRATRS